MYDISVVILFMSSIYFLPAIDLFERVEMIQIYEFVDLKL